PDPGRRCRAGPVKNQGVVTSSILPTSGAIREPVLEVQLARYLGRAGRSPGSCPAGGTLPAGLTGRFPSDPCLGSPDSDGAPHVARSVSISNCEPASGRLSGFMDCHWVAPGLC